MTGLTAGRGERFLRRRRWTVLAGVVVVIYGLAGGCYAEELPPRTDDALAAAGPLPYSVLVADWDAEARARTPQNPAAYGDKAFKFLKATSAFRSVRKGAIGVDSADFIAMSTGAYCNSAVIPIWTGLTLGFFPTIFTDTDCEGIVLRRYGAPHGADSVVISSTVSSRVVMGWVAIVVGLLPGWTHGELLGNRRAERPARLTILRQRGAIAALLAKP